MKPWLYCVVQLCTLNTEMSLVVVLAMASKLPSGLNASDAGPLPPPSDSGEGSVLAGDPPADGFCPSFCVRSG